MPRKQPATTNRARATQFREAALQQQLVYLENQLQELQNFLDMQGWERQFGGSDENWDFNREAVDKIIKLARLMYIKNPMVKRAVSVQSYYTFGLSVKFKSPNPAVKAAIDNFMRHRKNRNVIGKHIARLQKDAQLSHDGQIFFIFFEDADGSPIIRTLPIDEVRDIYRNPDDREEPWLYKRVRVTANGTREEVWYPDKDFDPLERIESPDGKPIMWENPVYHARGPAGIASMKFSIPEIYSILDWAMAHKNFLQDWLTIMKAYARVAMVMSGVNKKDSAAAKTKLGVTNSDNARLSAPAQFLMTGGGVELKAVKTAGATTSADEGRQVKLQIACGADLPETFFGDADVGNVATAESLDRPTELKMKSRQQIWREIYQDILEFVLERYNTSLDGPVDELILVEFPDILERNVDERIRALVGAFTMNGRQFNGLFHDPELMLDLTLEALGVTNREDIVKRIMSKIGDKGPLDLNPPTGPALGEDGPPSEGKAKKKTAGPAVSR